jgi:hypothetical protein
MRRLALPLAAIAVVAIAVAARAPAQTRGSANKDRRFFSARLGVGVEAPSGWALSLHTGYANVPCALAHPGGSRISLAVDRATAKDAAALVDESRPGFAAQGLTIDRVSPGPRGGTLVEARSRRNQAVRQLYLVRDVDAARGERQAIILTLTTAPADLPAAAPSFDWVVAHLTLEPPVRPEEKPDAGR